MVISYRECNARLYEETLNKEKTVFNLTRGPLKDKLKPTKEVLELTKEISKLCWRLLEAPDIYWDSIDEEVKPVALGEPDCSKGKESCWPLWTISDAVEWIRGQGCSVFSLYRHRDILGPGYEFEGYFRLGNGFIVFEKGENLTVVLLTFILKKLKGEYVAR